MENTAETAKDINIELKNLIEDIDNLSANIDLYGEIVEEQLLNI